LGDYEAIRAAVSDINTFTSVASHLTLRSYQKDVASALVDSVIHGKGLSFVVIFPRQSGKNELEAQIETYLLCIFSMEDAEMVKVSPTWKPQTLNAMHRLQRVLDRNMLTLFQ
jgi:phage terminase large subunit-like protein